MKALSTRSIMNAIASSYEGCRELDIFMYILLHPEKRYFYEDGQYYTFTTRKVNRKKIVLLKFVNKL